jgi:hypothetical protein
MPLIQYGKDAGRVVAPGEPFAPQRKQSPIPPAGAWWAYETGAAPGLPAAGEIKHQTGAYQLFFHEIDRDGISRRQALVGAVAGNVLTVGAQSGELTTAPVEVQPGVWQVYLATWLSPANGDYLVTLAEAAP